MTGGGGGVSVNGAACTLPLATGHPLTIVEGAARWKSKEVDEKEGAPEKSFSGT